MALFLGRVQRHHEALDTLGFLVHGQLLGLEDRQDLFFLGFGADVGQHRPRHHVGTHRQRRNRAVRAVVTRALACGQGVWHTLGTCRTDNTAHQPKH